MLESLSEILTPSKLVFCKPLLGRVVLVIAAIVALVSNWDERVICIWKSLLFA